MPDQDIEPVAKNGRKLALWNPKPLGIPEINQNAFEQQPVIRAAEVIRYSLHRFEYWVSPSGILREWLRLNLLVALFVGFTGILLAPVVTMILGEIAGWIILILKIVTGIVSIAAMAIVAFILLRIITAMCDSGDRR